MATLTSHRLLAATVSIDSPHLPHRPFPSCPPRIDCLQSSAVNMILPAIHHFLTPIIHQSNAHTPISTRATEMCLMRPIIHANTFLFIRIPVSATVGDVLVRELEPLIRQAAELMARGEGEVSCMGSGIAMREGSLFTAS